MNPMTSWTMQVLSMVMAAAAAPGLSVEPSDRLAAMDIFEFEFAADPQISPDGSRIIYVRQFADVMTDRYYSNLWIVNFDGSGHRPLTTGHQNDSSPRWSPDGTRLVYLSDVDESTQVYLRWMDTGQAARLTNLQHPPRGLSWSPDGTMFSFVSFVPAEPRVIGSMPKAPAEAQWAEPPVIIDRIMYRFDKAGYLKPGYLHLFVMPAEPGTPRQLTHGDFHFANRWGNATPEWDPAGKHLVISANLREEAEYEPLNSEVYEVSVADGSFRALTQRNGPDHSPALSPDGSHIAYVGFDDRYQGYQVTRLYVMKRDGTDGRVLTADLDRDVEDPRWSGDGTGLFFTYDDRGRSKLGFCTLDGKVTTVAEQLGGNGSAYGGASYSVGGRDHLAFNWTTPALPGDVAVAERNGAPSRALTSVNHDLLAHRTLGEVEELWYESSKDGRPIQGWIVKPPDYDPTRKYPLILEIHGGPFANYGDRFDLEKQLWVAKGYVVLYVNPRGSTGYGEEFGNLIHHAYPGDDYYDLDAGVDAVVAKGYADPDELFVTGGSGGGVLTCWMIARTPRFRAAAAAYPVINWYSFTLTADLSVFFTKYWFPGLPWEHPEHYMQRSLLSVVDKVKTPTMVITGEEDYRTPISESEQYYKALKLLKVESVLVRVPGEAHGIRSRPSHHLAKVLHILGWFDEHRRRPAAESP